jgi:hypothetical protein
VGFVSRIIMRGSLCYPCRHDFQDRCRIVEEVDSSNFAVSQMRWAIRGLDLLSMLLFGVYTKNLMIARKMDNNFQNNSAQIGIMMRS